MVARSLLGFALMLGIGPLLAGARDAAPLNPDDLMRVIRAEDDPATHAAAARVQAAAESGNSYAMYDLGSLYRQSSRKGKPVFAYDPGKSLKWLVAAFDGGRTTAAYKIALVYAELGDDMEAMGWAQVYSHYLHPEEERTGKQQQLRLALLNDLYARIGTDHKDAIEARLMTLLDRHAAKFEANVKRNELLDDRWTRDDDDCKLTNPPDGHRAGLRAPGYGLVEFLVAIDHDGSTGEFAALDAAPVAMHDQDLRQLVSRLRCDPDRRARYAFQIFNVQDDPELRLEND